VKVNGREGFVNSDEELPVVAGSGGDFVRDGLSGSAWISSSCDGAADDEEICARASGLRRSGDAGLIVCGGARGPDGGNQSEEIRSAGAADRGNLLRRGDNAIEARFSCEQGQSNRSGANSSYQADATHGRRVQTCQYCDAQQRGPASVSSESFAGRTHHSQTAGSVERKEADSRESGSGNNCPSDGVRNIVEFQVKEDFSASGCELLNCPGSFGGEELASNFEQVGDALKPLGQPHGWPQAVNIQRDN
jgi:hypothetical protein